MAMVIKLFKYVTAAGIAATTYDRLVLTAAAGVAMEDMAIGDDDDCGIVNIY